MDNKELIEVAKNLATKQWGIDPALLTKSELVDAVVIYFGKSQDSRMEIVLNKENGAFIGATMSADFEPGHN